MKKIIIFIFVIFTLFLSVNHILAVDTDLAHGKPITTSSAKSGYSGSLVVDGDLGSYWESNNGFSQFIQVDLGSIFSINKIVLGLPWGVRTENVTLQGSTDGVIFTNIVNATNYQIGTPNQATINFTNVNYRYIKLLFNSNNAAPAAQLSELQVWGSSISSPTPTLFPTATPTVNPSPTSTAIPTPTPTNNPNRPDHIVLVMEENHSFQEVLPIDYYTILANDGALMVNSFGIIHPSQGNYIGLFSGSMHGITNDICPVPGYPLNFDNIANQFNTHGLNFVGYAENLSTATDCTSNNNWDQNHVPWINFSNVPANESKDFNQFPTDFTQLPTLSFVIPNVQNDAHDGTSIQSSIWLKDHIESYRAWAMTHNSLLIVQFDEDDDTPTNQIYTVFVGPMIKQGLYNEQINHYSILSTIEDLYGLPHLNNTLGLIDIFIH